jgi:hypothetical protein
MSDKTPNVRVETTHTGRSGAGIYRYVATAQTREALEQWGNELLRSYHPAGYSTSINIPDSPNADGDWVAKAFRAGSCD